MKALASLLLGVVALSGCQEEPAPADDQIALQMPIYPRRLVSDTGPIRISDVQLQKAQVAWLQCKLSIVTTRSADTVNEIGLKNDGTEYVKLGTFFEGYFSNWEILKNRRVNASKGEKKGGDGYYSAEVYSRSQSIYEQTGGIVRNLGENYTALIPVEYANGRVILAHEIGHMLGIDDITDASKTNRLMYWTASDTLLTGYDGSGNLTPDSDCDIARRTGQSMKYIYP